MSGSAARLRRGVFPAPALYPDPMAKHGAKGTRMRYDAGMETAAQ